MGKFDVIDILLMSLISFYLLIFSIIFILLIRKHHGIRGLFRYLLDKNSITITNSGEVIEHIETETTKKNKKKAQKDKSLTKDNKVTIKQFFEKRIKSLKKDIAEELKKEDKLPKKEETIVVNTKATTKKPSTKKKTTSSSSKKGSNTKKSSVNKKPVVKKKPSTTRKKSTSTAKKVATNKKTNNKKTTSKKK